MIITHDMLDQTNASYNVIYNFDHTFPNGLDFSIKTYLIRDADYIVNFIIVPISELFSYTGLFTCCDGDEPYITYQLNFVNGYLENISKDKPALVRFNTITNLPLSVEFFNNGKINNPGKDKPAIITWYENGNIASREFVNLDVWNDPFSGIPSVIQYNENCKIGVILYYKDGLEDNPDPNTPARVLYYNDGVTPFCIQYYDGGNLNDPPNGNVAYTIYDENGNIKEEYHYKNGIRRSASNKTP